MICGSGLLFFFAPPYPFSILLHFSMCPVKLNQMDDKRQPCLLAFIWGQPMKSKNRILRREENEYLSPTTSLQPPKATVAVSSG